MDTTYERMDRINLTVERIHYVWSFFLKKINVIIIIIIIYLFKLQMGFYPVAVVLQ
jgi:hypothetical protein